MSMPPVVYGDLSKLPKKVSEFVKKSAILCKPKQIHICDGSVKENEQLIQILIDKGVAEKLAHEKHENCYAVRTDPRDVARVEARTFICTKNKHDAVPHFQGEVGRLGRWLSIEEAEKKLDERFPGCMAGRTMYVLPFSMGPVGSPVSKIGIELTDSEYVYCCMRIMTRLGSKVLKALGDGDFVKGLHSVGLPVQEGKDDPKWPCNPEKTIITHFPEKHEIKSFGSGYGGNSLLGKKCFALRIASTIARNEGWLAEHMMILGLTNPSGEKIYVAAAFPSACGKTNLAMLTPTLPGWKCECIGDDIAWMWFDKDGTLRAINPESGFFGVSPGTTYKSNPMAMKTFQKDTIFTNVATTSDGDFWWEGLEDPRRTGVTIKSWLGVDNWEEGQGKAAHPNSRFCAPSDHCPMMDKDWENPEGVPISAILFGGRRPHGVPLVFEAFNWQHGVFVASALSSEATAAAEFKGKTIMRDPFAMRPFFGYNFGKYLDHWLSLGKNPKYKLPKIFHVNWFRVDDRGHFLWPGFGENARVLEWVCRRVRGEDVVEASAVGFLPKQGSINLEGLERTPDIKHCLLVRKNYWLEEIDNLRLYYDKEVGEDLPQAIIDELNALDERVNAMKDDSEEGHFHSDYFKKAMLQQEIQEKHMPPVVYGDFSALSKKVQDFVREKAILCRPDQVHICDGSEEENKANIGVLIKRGAAVELAHEKHENCYAVFTDPRDVARVESRTFICTKNKHDAVPHFQGEVGRLGRWLSIEEADKKLDEYFPGCMKGRTMYVLPFSMGPVGSPVSKIGIELTDSEYVVCCMRIMTRMGSHVLKALGDGDFVKGLHSVGSPLKWGEVGAKWPCNPEKTIITHFPEKHEIKSFGSGYGGNSLLGKKCFALRIASNIARDEGWLAEHMMILGLTNPQGKKIYVAAAFPSACGKTNLAMLTPTLPGWKCECIGDDIAWMWFDKDGTLRAINPESGFFGVCPGTTYKTNPIAMKTFQKDTVFTNVAVTSDGDFWWEGLEDPRLTAGVTIKSWLGVDNWQEGQGKAAHPNSRFCAPSDHCPMMDKDWENPEGVPISAILFGGRRPHGVPLIYEAFNWQHGVFVASALSSEATAAAEFKGKTIMRDPFAMRPFFGYNFGKYLDHWLKLGKKPKYNLPKIFHVNWFRVDQDGHFLWPGFGENSRVLDWVCRRVNGEDVAEPSAVGLVPKLGTINLDGLNPTPDMKHLLLVRKKYWLEECQNLREYYAKEVGKDLPKVIMDELDALEKRINAISEDDK